MRCFLPDRKLPKESIATLGLFARALAQRILPRLRRVTVRRLMPPWRSQIATAEHAGRPRMAYTFARSFQIRRFAREEFSGAQAACRPVGSKSRFFLEAGPCGKIESE
jgi:hypothetical protein